MNPSEGTYGIFHMSITVTDMAEGIRRLTAFGGTFTRENKMDIPVLGGEVHVAFGTDPDGQIIELVL